MGKAKRKEPEPEFEFCETCQANFQGLVCPGCAPPPYLENDPPAPGGEPEPCGACTVSPGETIPVTEGGKCLECGREILAATAEEVAATLAGLATEVTQITETLKVVLTDLDYKDFGIKMGQANQVISKAEDELAAVKSQFKSRIDAAVANRNECAAIINAGCQYKPVECDLRKNYQENTVSVVRLDTGEIVSTRTMSGSERQRGLDFGKSTE